MQISIESLIIIVVGVASGWLAGQVMNGTGFGIFGDLIIGIIGAFVVAAATAPSPRGFFQRSSTPPSARSLFCSFWALCEADAAGAGSDNRVICSSNARRQSI
jgi:hypothetical protein